MISSPKEIVNRVSAFKRDLGNLCGKLTDDIKSMLKDKVLICSGECSVEYIFPRGFLPSLGCEDFGNTLFCNLIEICWDDTYPSITATNRCDLNVDDEDFLKYGVFDFDQSIINQINKDINDLIKSDTIEVDYWELDRLKDRAVYFITQGSLRTNIQGKLKVSDILPKISEIIGENLKPL